VRLLRPGLAHQQYTPPSLVVLHHITLQSRTKFRGGALLCVSHHAERHKREREHLRINVRDFVPYKTWEKKFCILAVTIGTYYYLIVLPTIVPEGD
jgi:hypothetical protein